MEVESTNCEDVAEPGLVASGTAGTGQTYGIKTQNAGKKEEKIPHVTHERVVIGLGVLDNRKIPTHTIQETTQDHVTSLEVAESSSDLIFSLFDREDRIRDRLQKKINRLDQRITILENRRRSQ